MTATCDAGYYCPAGMNISNPTEYTCPQGMYHISSVIRQSFFSSKTIQRSRSILEDGSSSSGLCRKGYFGIIAKFHRTDFLI